MYGGDGADTAVARSCHPMSKGYATATGPSAARAVPYHGKHPFAASLDHEEQPSPARTGDTSGPGRAG